MLNQDLAKRICDVTCSLEELKSISLSDGLFGLDEPFNEYYDLNSILKCFDLYEKGCVAEEFVAHWANGYGFVIGISFTSKIYKERESSVSLKDLVFWSVLDWLDTLAFFDGEAPYDSNYYKNAFSALDYVYKSLDKWTVYYSFKPDSCHIDACSVLLVNDSERSYMIFHVDAFAFRNRAIENARSLENLTDMVNQLIGNGYKTF